MGAYKRQKRNKKLEINYINYNEAMASMRIAVENGFVQIFNFWQAGNFKFQVKIGNSFCSFVYKINYIL